MFRFILFFVCSLLTGHLCAANFDLNTLQQPFILQTKKIHIPGHPEAFNGSIVAWKGRILMSFRTYHPETRSTDEIWLVWLDENFEPLGFPMMLERRGEVTAEISRAQDPRLLVVGENLFIVYSNQYPFKNPVSRMYVAKIEAINDSAFSISNPSPLLHYDDEARARKEKNWVPFESKGQLLLSYSLQPHRVFQPSLDLNACATIAESKGDVNWNWGQMRGGTPAVLVGDRYLAFFHSDKAMETVQSQGKMINHYLMGAYTFDAKPPYALKGVSPEPLVARSFYEGPMYDTWKPLREIFPMGIIIDRESVWVSYGRQDHEIWVAKIDLKGLMKSLAPVNTVKKTSSP